MTYFNDGSQTTENQQQQQAGESDQDFITRVVAAKGEHWKDPNTIAKGYLESQQFIDTLKQQIAEMKEDLSKEEYAKQVLEALKQQGKPTGGEAASQSTSTNTPNNQQGVSVDEIKTLIEKTLTEKEETNSAKQNLAEANRMLEEAFGATASSEVEERRKALGLSKERLQQIAAESPSAFLTLLGKPPSKQTNTVAQNQMNTAGVTSQSSERNWAYYQKLRRENKNAYYSSKVQNQMVQDRMTMGEQKFYAS